MSAIAVVAETARVADENTLPGSSSVSPETLQRHIDACGPAVSNKSWAFLKRLFLSDSLKTDIVSSTDKTSRKAADSALHSLIN